MEKVVNFTELYQMASESVYPVEWEEHGPTTHTYAI